MQSIIPIATIGLALIHLIVGRYRVEVFPHDYWRSVAGGVAVAYVFVHLLPGLAEGQEIIKYQGLTVRIVDYYTYLLALIGFLAFYEVE